MGNPDITDAKRPSLPRPSSPTRDGGRLVLPPTGRAIIALVALYALALQSVLGGMLLAGAIGPEHVLCLSVDGPSVPGPAGKHLPVHGHLACCTATHAPMPAALPVSAPAAIVPTHRVVAILMRRPESIARPRAPPGIGPGPRGPPVA